MLYRIEVWLKFDIVDGREKSLVDSINSLGHHLDSIAITDLYFIKGDVSDADIEKLCQELLSDPVSQDCYWRIAYEEQSNIDTMVTSVEVAFRPGVTDSVAESIKRGAKLIGVTGIEQVATGKCFDFRKLLPTEQAGDIARSVLCNDVVQYFSLGSILPPFVDSDKGVKLETIPILQATDKELRNINKNRLLSLNLEEMQTIQTYFQEVGRDPTDAELETLAQTWSEHCKHKTFHGVVDYNSQQINGLLNTYLRKATEELNKPWVRSAFVDNAGIIDFGLDYELSFKVETHNHPSALEPFGGANTGVGGVIRDIMGVSARPIANTDVLCFGLQSERVFTGVVAGVEDYGNKMGIPTVGGALLFDDSYKHNPLVFCGCLGLAPKGAHPTEPREGDYIVVLGGRTGRDGLRGATFSSTELTHVTSEESGSAVQIGNPIVQKNCLEAIIQARDEGLYNAITDCGAGGLSSAIGEMGSELGARVYLEHVPLKYAGLSPWEIWLSEAQERMVLSVPPCNFYRVMEICNSLGVEATHVGDFTHTGKLVVSFGGLVAVNMDMEFLHHGIPQRKLKGTWQPKRYSNPEHPTGDLTSVLLKLLSDPNIASKEKVIRLYDHEVQGATVVKPLVGVRGFGPSDAVVLKPLQVSGNKGIVLSHGINPHYGKIDPYLMAHAVIDEAVRNAVCVGVDPDYLAILDNFCWGDPSLPDRMGDLVRACQGCYDGAKNYRVPFISGKDSLNNEYVDVTGKRTSILPTLLISAIGTIPDFRQAVTMDLKEAGSLIYAIGETKDELGGSYYYRLQDMVGNNAPQPATNGLSTARKLHKAMMVGVVQSCHDCSEGGWVVALAEMSLAGESGLNISLAQLPGIENLSDDVVCCFSESNGRYIVEIKSEDKTTFERTMSNCSISCIGVVTDTKSFIIKGLQDREIIRTDVSDLERAWRGLND